MLSVVFIVVFVCLFAGIAYYASEQIVATYKILGTGTPGDISLPFEEVEFETHDGLNLSGWYIPNSGSGKTIVLCHGQMDNRCNCLPYADFLHRAGYALFLFDFRAHGKSEGDICTLGFFEVKDLERAVEYLVNEKSASWIGVLGRSMGGSIAILEASRNPAIKAVVADCPFLTLEQAVEDVCRMNRLPALGGRMGMWMCRLRFGLKPEQVNILSAAQKLGPRPFLLIHGEKDPVIPVSRANQLNNVASGPKDFWVVPNAGHVQGISVAQEEYIQRVTKFFKSARSET